MATQNQVIDMSASSRLETVALHLSLSSSLSRYDHPGPSPEALHTCTQVSHVIVCVPMDTTPHTAAWIRQLWRVKGQMEKPICPERGHDWSTERSHLSRARGCDRLNKSLVQEKINIKQQRKQKVTFSCPFIYISEGPRISLLTWTADSIQNKRPHTEIHTTYDQFSTISKHLSVHTYVCIDYHYDNTCLQLYWAMLFAVIPTCISVFDLTTLDQTTLGHLHQKELGAMFEDGGLMRL